MSGNGMRVVIALAFVAMAGSALAATEQDVSLTVAIRSLGVSVTPATYDFGVMDAGEIKCFQNCVTITNSGNDAEDIGLRVKDEDDQNEWTLGDPPAENAYRLGAHLAADNPGVGTILSTTTQWADGANFAGGGNDMAPAASVPMGFEFSAPTSVSGTHASEQHTITVEVSCRLAE